MIRRLLSGGEEGISDGSFLSDFVIVKLREVLTAGRCFGELGGESAV